jgi:hypothetical protein
MYNQYQPPRKNSISLGQMLFVLAVIAFAGYFIYNTLSPQRERTAQIVSDTIGTTKRGEALLVRSEVPYDAEGVTNVDYVAEEGKMIFRSNTICYVYSSGYNQKEMASLQKFRDQIKQKHMQLLGAQISYDQRLIRLEADVLERAKEIRRLVQGASGNLNNQGKMLDASMAARQNYLRTKYADDQSLSRLYDDEESQLKRIESWTKQYNATAEGIVSFYSDGYEYALNASDYTKFTPQEVRSMIEGNIPEKTTTQKGRTTIYRLVRQNTWHVLMLIKDAAWSPIDGQSYKLHLVGFDDTVVDANVISSTRSGGELLVRLEVHADVVPVLYLRTCEAELGEYVNSMVVPQSAIYKHEGADGVVIVNGDANLFVPIKIVKRDGERVFIEAIQQGLLYVGQTVLLN